MRDKTRLEVHLDRLSDNIESLKSICSKNEILFMVKADGYGHGAEAIVRTAYFENQISEFGVATLAEALELRRNVPNGSFEIYIFSETLINHESVQEVYLENSLTPVIYDLRDLQTFLKNYSKTPLVLKINTGMNRLGILNSDIGEVVSLLKKNGRTQIDHLMTHFSCSSQSVKNVKMTNRQIEEFETVKKELSGAGITISKTSVSNSGAIEQSVGLDESHVRPGLMLYGPSALVPNLREKSVWKGKVISNLKSNILKTFPVKKGCPIGYGATPVHADGFISVAAIGYGDGFTTRLQGIEFDTFGERVKVCGRVNMDMVQIFHASESLFEGKEEFDIWNDSPQSIYEISDKSQMIPYELFCLLGQRVPRIHKWRKS